MTDQKKVANIFSRYYANVANNLLKNIEKTPTKFQDYLKNPNENSMFLNEIDPGDVFSALSSLDTKKSGEIYGLTPYLLKQGGSELSGKLSVILMHHLPMVYSLNS